MKISLEKMVGGAEGGPRFKFFRSLLAAFCLLLSAYSITHAHDPGLSAVDLRLNRSQLLVTLTFARSDIEPLCVIDANHDGKISAEELSFAGPQLEAIASGALDVKFDYRAASARDLKVDIDDSNAVHFHLRFPADINSRLSLRSTILSNLARGHKQYLSLRDDHGKVIAERMLDANGDEFETNLSDELFSESKLESFRRFLVLGVEHILTGYDHLAFLLALLLAGGSLREVAKIITSFTLAHSITLALATFDVVRLPAGVVEPLIAVSIIYVGLENLWRRDLLRRRWLLTFGFGLIHGLGFATALRELGIGSGVKEAVAPLLSFNLGVEFGQIAIAALLLPLIWKLRRRPAFLLRYVPVCSAVVAVLGSYWLLERTLLK
jgi:hydrogenase/urease accessory protein HupE